MTWTNPIPSTDASNDLLADLLGVALRRKLLILAVLIATTLGCYVALAFISEQYEAEARLLVKLGRENAEVPLTVDKGGVYSTGVAKEEINSNIQLLTSRSLMEMTVDSLGVDRFTFVAPRPPGFFAAIKYYTKQAYRSVRKVWSDALIALDLKKAVGPREAAVNLLAAKTTAARERDSNVTIVKIRLPDPKLALDAMTTLLAVYRQRHIDVQREGNLRQVFDQQSTDLAEELSALQQRMLRLKSDAKVSSAPEQRSQYLQRLDQLRRGIDAKTTERYQLLSEQETLRARLATLPASLKSQEVVEPNRGSRAMRERLIALRLKRVEVGGRYSESGQLVKNIDDEIASIEKVLSTESQTETGEVTFERNPVAAQFEVDLERTHVKLAGLTAAIHEEQRQIAEIEAALRKLEAGDESLRLAELQRRVLEEKFLTTASRSSAARIAEDFDQRQLVNLAILGEPSVPEVPVYPPKLLYMGIAIGVGLLLGFAAALALEWSSDLVRGPRDLTAIAGVPFLGRFACEPRAGLGG